MMVKWSETLCRLSCLWSYNRGVYRSSRGIFLRGFKTHAFSSLMFWPEVFCGGYVWLLPTFIIKQNEMKPQLYKPKAYGTSALSLHEPSLYLLLLHFSFTVFTLSCVNFRTGVSLRFGIHLSGCEALEHFLTCYPFLEKYRAVFYNVNVLCAVSLQISGEFRVKKSTHSASRLTYGVSHFDRSLTHRFENGEYTCESSQTFDRIFPIFLM